MVNKFRAEECKRNLAEFVKEFWDEIVPNALVWGEHMNVVCAEIERVSKRVFKRLPKQHDLIINVPPGTSKTLICSVFATCWEFANNPTLRIFVGSYSDKAILGIADNIHLVMGSEKYKSFYPKVQIRQGANTKHNFKTTKNGEFYAFTTNGTITSKHADILKVDDPLDPKQSASAANLKTANFFMEKVLPTRKVDKEVTPTVLIMQRLNQEDPTGKMLERNPEGVRHICLPGEISNNVKPIEYQAIYEGGLLDPKRMPRIVLKELKRDLGESAYAGQIQQKPNPDEGSTWKAPWFQIVPDHLFPKLSLLKNLGTDWDLAYTKEKQNSASAYVTAGNYGTDIYIHDCGWGWYEFTDLIAFIKERHQPHYIENKASGKSAKQTLVKLGINAIEIPVTTDKTARANFATPTAQAGRVFVRQSIAEKLLYNEKQGVTGFPNNQGDLADTISQSIMRLNKVSGGISVSVDGDDDDGGGGGLELLELLS